MSALLCVLVLPVLGGPLGNPGDEGKRPSVQELIEQVRFMDSRSKQVRSIEISATSHTGGRADLDYHLSYQAPGHCRFSIRDSLVGTPLLLYSDHRLMIYDAGRATVLYSESSSLDINLTRDSLEKTLFHFEIHMPEKKTATRILCAFPQILAANWKSQDVRKSSNSRYKLTCLNERNDRLEAVFDEEKPDPLVSLQFIRHEEKPHPLAFLGFSGHDEERRIVFSEIAVNEPVHHQSFRLPDRDDLAAAGLKVIDLNLDKLGFLSALHAFLQARASIPRALMPRASRKDTAKRDNQISRTLRKMTLSSIKVD